MYRKTELKGGGKGIEKTIHMEGNPVTNPKNIFLRQCLCLTGATREKGRGAVDMRLQSYKSLVLLGMGVEGVM
jgi:hypothetical protein